MKNKKKPKLKKYSNGGNKFLNESGQLLGNIGKADADVTLSAIGMNNVVPDSSYKGLGANNFRQVANIYGGIEKSALPLAANIAAPGSGALVSGVQKIGSNYNPKSQNLDQYSNLINQTQQFQQSLQVPPIYKHGGIKHKSHLNQYPNFSDSNAPSGMYSGNSENYNGTFANGGINYGIPKGKYEMGGNAELEKQEVFKTPNGDIDGVNGDSHANGGVQVNIPENTKILSDKLKMPNTKLTFAKLGAKYKTDKEDKILADSMATPNSQITAKLTAQIKQRKLDELFKAQESLKNSKLQSYADKLGITLPQVNKDNELTEQDQPQQEGEFAYGGINELPEYAHYIPLNKGEYKYGGIHIKPSHEGRFTAYKERTGSTTEEALHSSNPHVRQMANFDRNASHWKHEMGGIHKYDDGGLTDTSNEIDPNISFNSSPYLDKFVNEQTTADQDFNSINNYNFDKSMIKMENTPITPSIPNSSLKIPYGDIASSLAGSAGAIYGLATNKKLPRVQYNTPNIKYLDPSAELRSNTQVNANSRNMLKENVGGNAGAYLANIGQIGAQNAERNAATISKYNNANVGIYNQNQSEVANINNKGIDETRGDQAQTRNLNTAYIGQIGRQATQSYLDYKRGNMDQNTAKLLSSAFANYGLDMSNPDDWKVYFKQTGGKI